MARRLFLGNAKSKNRSEGAKWKSGVLLPKTEFWAEMRIFGPKKRSLIDGHHVLATTWQSCAKKKSIIFSNEYQSFRGFWVGVFFSQKNCIFGPKTASLSMWVIFLVARTVPPSFVDHGPKLRALILTMGHWPEMAKFRDEPWKMTPNSDTKTFFGVGSLERTSDMPF